MAERHSRQLDLYNPTFDMNPNILIVWAGWIWSTTAYSLAKMGFNHITVVDYDEVEEHNINSQFYKESQLGMIKVEALKENIKDFTGVEITAINGKFLPEHIKQMDIVLFAVDDMEVRKEIAEACTTDTIRMIDTRMAGEFFEIHSFIPVYELPMYMQTRYSSEEASPEKCTSKAVCYNCLAIWAYLARIVKWIAKEEKYILDKNNRVIDLHNMMIA